MTKKIMIVDDEPSMLSLVSYLLQRKGYTVVKVSDPYQALSLIEATSPDLFILDNMMPGMNGTELTKHLRAQPETAEKPIIMFSGKFDEASVSYGRSCGVNAYLNKGATNELVAEVQKWLE